MTLVYHHSMFITYYMCIVDAVYLGLRKYHSSVHYNTNLERPDLNSIFGIMLEMQLTMLEKMVWDCGGHLDAICFMWLMKNMSLE